MKIAFDQAQLPGEAKSILQSKSSVYARSTSLRQFVESLEQPEIHLLLCLANLEMACAEATGFEEDIIDFGTTALEWLNRALEIEPGNESIGKYIHSIRKKIKRAEKSANEILSYEKEDLDEIADISYVEELAFYYYSRRKKSVEFAKKGHAICLYVYHKKRADSPDLPELLYYWHALTICKFTAYGYNGSEAEVEQLINWQLTRETMCYRESITDAYWIKLLNYSEVDDISSFRKLYTEWYDRMTPLEKSGKPYLALLEVLNPISRWLLKQADANIYLAYIFENGYNFFNKSILGEEHLEVMERIRERL